MDPQTFKVSFMSPLSKSCEKSLANILKQHQDLALEEGTKKSKQYKEGDSQAEGFAIDDVYSSIKPICHEYEVNDDKNIKYYSAEYIFESMVQEFNKSISKGKNMLIGWLLGFMWAFVPSVLRVVSGQEFHGTGPIAITATYCNGLLSSFLFFVQFMFYLQAINDMRRKHFLVCQLGYMMSPKMVKMYPFDKMFPTVLLLDRISLMTWYKIIN